MPGDFVFSQYGPVCEIGLGDVRHAEPDSWFDVSCHVIQAETFCGHERFNERFEPGTATVTFENRSGWADLVGDAWTVGTALMRPGRPIRIGVAGPFDDGPVVTRWLWRGWIDQAVPAYEPQGGLTDTVTVNCIDALGEAGQTTAVKTRDPVGVHESAADRINRVLDAVGWFPTKRKIEATTTLVQGTTLGSQAMDLMTVAADTAGGVVFGDLDGDVVFKGIDWMLYKPTDPPDGTIGNSDAPKPPLPGQPPYMDPVEGTIRYENGLLPVPQCVNVCVAPAEGTVVEQGDAWRIYMHNGHLWYESSGHLWDMGVWDATDQCTRICKSTTPGGPPTRHDAGDISEPSIGTQASWEFTVDFLGYSDGGIADGAKQYVAVPAITPGPDCLVVVLISAVADGIPVDASLSPFPEDGGAVSGGSLAWKYIGIKNGAGLSGAESYAVAAEVGRNDPGTFALVVDWAHEYAAAYHVVTVWRVKGHRKDMLQRMTLAAYLHGSTHDLPIIGPNPPPGRGPTAVPFVTIDTAGTAIVPGTRATDITIAQSLAEDEKQPFGATFDDSDGAWTTPVLGPPAARARSATDWLDEFERPDGPIGPDWTLAPTSGRVPPSGSLIYPFTIEGGAAVGNDVPNTGSRTSRMHWAAAQDVDQSIGIVVDNAIDNNGYLLLYTNGNDTDPTCMLAEFNFYDSGTPGVGDLVIYVYRCSAAGLMTPLANVSVSYPPLPRPMTLTFQSDATGEQRVIVDGAVVLSLTVAAPPVGPYTGIEIGVATYLGSPYDSPRILTAGSHLPTAKKCSWVAGYRTNAVAIDSRWTEVNTGGSDIQSCQVEVVLESGEDVGFAWRPLAYGVFAPTTGLPTGNSSRTVTIRPERAGKIVVFVGFTAPVDRTSLIQVTSGTLTFTRMFNQPPAGSGWAQGCVFSATLDNHPVDLNDPVNITVLWGDTVEKIGFVVMEVANAGSFGASAGGVAGSHTSGSVTGAGTLTFAPAPAINEVALGFLFGSDLDASANGSLAGIDMSTELLAMPSNQYAWLHVESRDSTTTPTITWSLMDASSPAQAKDVVMLGVVVKPLAGFADWSTFDTVVIGGSTNKYNAPIYSAAGTGPGGTPIWAFDPTAPGGVP